MEQDEADQKEATLRILGTHGGRRADKDGEAEPGSPWEWWLDQDHGRHEKDMDLIYFVGKSCRTCDG